MSASDIVPLTITYAPSGGATSTATVLGQVLNNGQTNWIPSGSNALYIAPSSAKGDVQTVVAGKTYFLSLGPAVPDQATGEITVTGAASTASGGATTPNSTPTQASAAATTTASTPAGTSTSASASASAKSGAAPMLALNHLGGRMAYALVFFWVVGVVAM